MGTKKELKLAIDNYYKKHREAYENKVAGKFSTDYQLHQEVRNAGYQVVLAAEKVLGDYEKEVSDK